MPTRIPTPQEMAGRPPAWLEALLRNKQIAARYSRQAAPVAPVPEAAPAPPETGTSMSLLPPPIAGRRAPATPAAPPEPISKSKLEVPALPENPEEYEAYLGSLDELDRRLQAEEEQLNRILSEWEGKPRPNMIRRSIRPDEWRLWLYANDPAYRSQLLGRLTEIQQARTAIESNRQAAREYLRAGQEARAASEERAKARARAFNEALGVPSRQEENRPPYYLEAPAGAAETPQDRSRPAGVPSPSPAPGTAPAPSQASPAPSGGALPVPAQRPLASRRVPTHDIDTLRGLAMATFLSILTSPTANPAAIGKGVVEGAFDPDEAGKILQSLKDGGLLPSSKYEAATKLVDMLKETDSARREWARIGLEQEKFDFERTKELIRLNEKRAEAVEKLANLVGGDRVLGDLVWRLRNDPRSLVGMKVGDRTLTEDDLPTLIALDRWMGGLQASRADYEQALSHLKDLSGVLKTLQEAGSGSDDVGQKVLEVAQKAVDFLDSTGDATHATFLEFLLAHPENVPYVFEKKKNGGYRINPLVAGYLRGETAGTLSAKAEEARHPGQYPYRVNGKTTWGAPPDLHGSFREHWEKAKKIAGTPSWLEDIPVFGPAVKLGLAGMEAAKGVLDDPYRFWRKRASNLWKSIFGGEEEQPQEQQAEEEQQQPSAPSTRGLSYRPASDLGTPQRFVPLPWTPAPGQGTPPATAYGKKLPWPSTSPATRRSASPPPPVLPAPGDPSRALHYPTPGQPWMTPGRPSSPSLGDLLRYLGSRIGASQDALRNFANSRHTFHPLDVPGTFAEIFRMNPSFDELSRPLTREDVARWREWQSRALGGVPAGPPPFPVNEPPSYVPRWLYQRYSPQRNEWESWNAVIGQ